MCILIKSVTLLSPSYCHLLPAFTSANNCKGSPWASTFSKVQSVANHGESWNVPVATVACFFAFMFFVLVSCSDLEGDHLVGGVEEIGVDQGRVEEGSVLDDLLGSAVRGSGASLHEH